MFFRLVYKALTTSGNDPNNKFGTISSTNASNNDGLYNQIKGWSGVSEVSSATNYSIFKGTFTSTGKTVIGFYINNNNVVYLSGSSGTSTTKTAANFKQYVGTITKYLKFETTDSTGGSGSTGGSTTTELPPEDVGDNFDAFIICPGSSANTAGKALTLNDTAYKYSSASGKDDNPQGRNVYGANPDFTNTRQIWHFSKRSDGTYNIYCEDVRDNNKTKFYLQLQTGKDGNKYTEGKHGTSYWNVIGWDTANIDSNQNCWKLTEYDGDQKDLSGASINNGGLSLYYIKSVSTIKDGNQDESVDAQKVKLNLEVSDTVAYTAANAHLYNAKNYTCAFYIYKINTISSGSTVQITSCKDDSLSLNANDVNNFKCTTNILDWNNSDLSNQAWIFDRVGTSVPARYTIRSEAQGTYLYVDNYGRGNLRLNSIADTSSPPTNAQWMLLGHSTIGLKSVSLVPVTTFDSGTPVTEACSSGGNGSSYANKEKVLRVVDVNLNNTPSTNTSYGNCSAYNFKLGTNQFFSLSSIRVNLGNFVSPIKSSLQGGKYGLSLLDKANDTQPSTGYDRSDPTNGRAIVLRQIATNDPTKNSGDCTAADEQWHFELDTERGGNVYKIINGGNKMLLTVNGGVYQNNREVGVEPDRGDSSRWYVYRDLSTASSGYYSLISYGDQDFALDVQSGTVPLTSDKHMEIWPFTVGVNRLFVIDPTNEARYNRNCAEPSKETFWAYIGTKTDETLYLKSPKTSELKTTTGTDMKFTAPGSEAEKRTQEYTFKFEPNPDGSYVITSCSETSNYTSTKGKVLMFNRTSATNYDHTAGVNKGVNLHNEGDTPGLDKNFYITPYEIDGKTYYTISVKDNGQMALRNTGDNTLDATYDIETSVIPEDVRLFTIEKTDLTISADMPNVKMHLFNYGSAINDITKVNSIYNNSSVLSFFQSAWDASKWDGNVDGITTDAENKAYFDNDYIPLMSKKLGSDGFPLVEKYVNPHSTNTGKVESGSLKYLFDPEMGKNNNGFVQGSGSQTLYDTSAETVSYQSQHFSVNNPTSLFKKNPNTGLYYYDSLLNAAYFKRDKDSEGKELTSGNFNLYDYTERRYNNGYSTGKESTTGLNTTSGHFFPFNMGHVSGNVDYGGGNRPTIGTSNQYVTAGEPAPVDYKFGQSTNVDTWFGMTFECEFQQTGDGTFNGNDMIFEFKGDDDVWVYIDDVLVLDVGGAHTPREASVNFRTGEVTYPGRDESTGKVSGTVTTNLRNLFNSAGVSTKDFNSSGVTNTFQADSKHNLKFFILERGGADSYFHLVFNLPKGTPSVTKEVDYYDSNFNDNRDYRFKIEKYNSETQEYENFSSDITYLLEDKDGTSVDGNVLASDGTFKLKAGQTAFFHNIDDNTKFRVTELYDVGTSKTITQYTKSYINSNGNRTIEDDKGNRVAVDDNEDIVTDDSGYVVKVDDNGSIVTGQNYGYKLNEITEPIDRVMGPYPLDTSVEQNLKFTNSLQTTSLTINEEVYYSDNDSWTKVESVPGAVYNFSLRLFRKNSDGTTVGYGQKDFSISGDNLKEEITFDNLPVGVSYELWEYYPSDEERYYIPPEFKSNTQEDTVTGSFVIAGESPGLNSGINGALVASGDSIQNKITVTNKYAGYFRQNR